MRIEGEENEYKKLAKRNESFSTNNRETNIVGNVNTSYFHAIVCPIQYKEFARKEYGWKNLELCWRKSRGTLRVFS